MLCDLWNVLLLILLRLLGCRGLTPSQRRRLDSWPGHLLNKFFNAHYRLLVYHILQALHDQELALMQALQHRKEWLGALRRRIWKNWSCWSWRERRGRRS